MDETGGGERRTADDRSANGEPSAGTLRSAAADVERPSTALADSASAPEQASGADDELPPDEGPPAQLEPEAPSTWLDVGPGPAEATGAVAADAAVGPTTSGTPPDHPPIGPVPEEVPLTPAAPPGVGLGAEGLPPGSTPEDGESRAPSVDSAVPSSEFGELEELILPSSIQAPPPLEAGTALGPDGRLRVVEHLGAAGRVNRYAATWQADEVAEPIAVELREAPADHSGLRREAEVLAAVRYAMLPTPTATFEQDGRRYLALEQLAGETLAEALQAGSLGLDRVVSIVLQLAQVLRRLHRSGWALVGLAPRDVVLGQPLKLAQLGSAVRIGEPPPQALQVAGFSAPELAHGGPVTGQEDVFSLGAILYCALAGEPPPEAGPELAALPLLVRVPGGPQLLARALAPADERLDLEGFYRALLDLKERQSRVVLALEVASATSVGLNPTRLVNEDSCGYVTWSEAALDAATYHALLCVADGMGGMDAGEVASSTALRSVLQAARAGAVDSPILPLSHSPALDPVALIRRAAPAVHAAGQGRQMGTTCTVAVVRDGLLTLGHVGDTRAYLLRDGVLTQLTNDHSLVAAMVASGVITKEEARGHPDSNKVLRSLGSQRELPEKYVDDLSAAYGQPSLRLQPRDWLLLCTDGVWGQVDDDEIRVVLSEALDCPTAARVLVERALQAGAPDNAAAVVARCVELPTR